MKTANVKEINGEIFCSLTWVRYVLPLNRVKQEKNSFFLNKTFKDILNWWDQKFNWTNFTK